MYGIKKNIVDVLKADVLHIIIGPKCILELLSEGEFINILLFIYLYRIY